MVALYKEMDELISIDEIENEEQEENPHMYLLTYEDDYFPGAPIAAWFDTEEELREYVKKFNIRVIEILHVIEAIELEE
jgi:hypothetical protein